MQWIGEEITPVQSEYSLWNREPEEEMLTTCKGLGIAFVPYRPLGRGLLTGTIKKFEDLAGDDWRRVSPRFMGDNFQKNLNLVKETGSTGQAKKLHGLTTCSRLGGGARKCYLSHHRHQASDILGRKCWRIGNDYKR